MQQQLHFFYYPGLLVEKTYSSSRK